MDRLYIDLGAPLGEDELATVIDFAFVDGGTGSMSRFEILMHLANHATYYRGFISDLLYQIPLQAGANDFTVFLQDAWPALQDAA